MVNIVDGLVEKKKEKEKQDLVYKLAVSIFGKNRVSPREDPSSPLTVYSPLGYSQQARIYPISNLIESERKEDYMKCLELAEACEKVIGQEFTLKTFYRKK
ncbi:MAG: hypothetical protein ACP5NZ_02040 [Nanobdellota archaeon]